MHYISVWAFDFYLYNKRLLNFWLYAEPDAVDGPLVHVEPLEMAQSCRGSNSNFWRLRSTNGIRNELLTSETEAIQTQRIA